MQSSQVIPSNTSLIEKVENILVTVKLYLEKTSLFLNEKKVNGFVLVYEMVCHN